MSHPSRSPWPRSWPSLLVRDLPPCRPHHRPFCTAIPAECRRPVLSDWTASSTSCSGGRQQPPGVDRPATGGRRPRVHVHRPPVAGCGPGPGSVAGDGGLDVVQTGAWILPDERPLPAELVAFLDAGEPPVYVGFGSMRSP